MYFFGKASSLVFTISRAVLTLLVYIKEAYKHFQEYVKAKSFYFQRETL